MERQNVTLSLPKTLLKKAKALAAMKNRSLSGLMRKNTGGKDTTGNGIPKSKGSASRTDTERS